MDIDEIMARKAELVSYPGYKPSDDAVDEAVRILKSRTPKSEALAKRAAWVIPGGVQHMLSNRKPYPLAFDRAEGARLRDLDGNEYVDFLLMAGPILLGHNYPPLRDGMMRVQEEDGIGTGLSSRWEVEAAEAVGARMKSVEMIRYLQSGSEADMAAARVSRACTGRRRIVRVGGAYHGWADEFIYDMHIPYSGAFEAHGIPPEHYSNVRSVPPNDLGALDAAVDSETAAVFLEPAGPETGAIPLRPAFLGECRRLCDERGALLVFDEVVTGFRFARGGAQEYYGIEADLTVLGKILTHGYPSCGALGGRREYMSVISGVEGKSRPFLAGTLAANNLSCAATCLTLDLIDRTGAIDASNRAAERLTSGLNTIFRSAGLPFFAYRTASLVHFETACPLAVDIRRPGAVAEALDRKEAVDRLFLILLSEGIVTKYGARAFTSLAHDDATIDRSLAVFEKVFGLYKKP